MADEWTVFLQHLSDRAAPQYNWECVETERERERKIGQIDAREHQPAQNPDRSGPHRECWVKWSWQTTVHKCNWGAGRYHYINLEAEWK